MGVGPHLMECILPNKEQLVVLLCGVESVLVETPQDYWLA